MDEPSRQALSVVLVDDEEEVLFSSKVVLETHGIFPVVTLADGRELLSHLEKHEAGIIVLDLFMPHASGVQLLPELVQRHPEIPVVVVTASQEVETAVACMKEGAFDYLVKPVEENRYVSSVNRALEMRSLRRQVGALKKSLLGERLEHDDAFASIITNSPKMQSIFRYVEAIAETKEPVLITGETGVGKGLIAEAVHQISRRKGALVSVNVAGLDDTMFSDTLFGHRKGAYTGADSDRDGMIGKAAGGSLFLDEIGDLKKSSQVKLLRLFQEQTYYPLGSDVAKSSDARIIAATNRDVRGRMAEGRFRQDLYYRLSSHQINVPPLRERREDIPLLVAHFLEEAARSLGKIVPEPTPELLTLLSVYHFPGNVRELRALVYDAMARYTAGRFLSMDSFREAIQHNSYHAQTPPAASPPEIQTAIRSMARFPTLTEFQRLLIEEALRRARGNQGIAAMLLGISRPALNRRLSRMKAKGSE